MKENGESRFVVGLDIGGANTKYAAFERVSPTPGKPLEGLVLDGIEYFPVWQKSRSEIPLMLEKIAARVLSVTGANPAEIAWCVTTTAELSDAFQTKREGVLEVARACGRAFPSGNLNFLNVEGRFIDLDGVIGNPLQVAAANWVATAIFVGHLARREKFSGILVDVGSTTTDIIPVLDGWPRTVGKDDTSRMVSGELVYTGILRATIPSVARRVPYRGGTCPVSFEKFALMADVYYLLGDISGEDYTCETADGRPVTVPDALSRLAHIVCGDRESVSGVEVRAICEALKEAHLSQVIDGIKQVVEGSAPMFSGAGIDEVPFIVTGLGANIVRPAIEGTFPGPVISMEELLGHEANVVSSAAAVALCRGILQNSFGG
ncbi:MAG: hydantoinase/oxoprolinase family protein [Promethearchaeota archaeon]